MIPAECLEGGPVRDVRYVTANLQVTDRNLQERFETGRLVAHRRVTSRPVPVAYGALR